jgi:flagellar export protein FliJ
MSRFRLQRVLDLRRRAEEAAQQGLATAAQARVGAEERLRALHDDEQRQREELSAMLAGGRIDAGRIGARSLHIELCGRAIDAQRAEVARCLAVEHAARARLTQAMVERKALDRLRERHEQRVSAEEKRREAVFLDEIACARAARA